jgi:hypothetical protein
MAAKGYKEDSLYPTETTANAGKPLLSDTLKKMARQGNPGLAARQDYDQAVTNYQNCLIDNPSNPSVCDGQRAIMDADAKVLSGLLSSSQNKHLRQRGTLGAPPAGRLPRGD